MSASSFFTITASLALSVLFIGSCTAQLSEDYYSESCPNVLDTVKSVVRSAVSKEPRMGASLLRLQFHDCFVNGCDGSILLDDTPSLKGEKTASVNNNSLRGFDVVDKIKSMVEKVCPGVVSCADIITIAAQDSVALLGGPNWDVKLGRRDSRTVNFSAADSWEFLPSGSVNLTQLISKFEKQGLSAKDMVALSGAHTIGQASCSSFRDRIYNDTNIDISFANVSQQKCPKFSGSGDGNQANLDFESPNTFDNSYFKLLIQQKGLLHSDQELFNGGSTDSLVRKYSNNIRAFYADFVEAMVNMGDIKPLTGSDGEIRKDCRKVN